MVCDMAGYELKKKICDTMIEEVKRKYVKDGKEISESEAGEIYIDNIEKAVDQFKKFINGEETGNDDWDYKIEETIIKYDVDKFIFRNQSLTTIANDIFQTLWGYIPTSYYNKRCLKMINKYSPEPLIYGFGSVTDHLDLKSFDICKCYSSILRDNVNDIPIYTIHDNIEAYDGGEIEVGEYFVKDVVLPFETVNGEKIELSNCFRSHATVKYLLEKGIITKDQYSIYV